MLDILCLVDSKSLCEAIKSSKAVTEKRLRSDIAAIKESLEDKQLTEVRWIGTENQLADCLTKKGSSPFNLLCALESGCVLVPQ